MTRTLWLPLPFVLATCCPTLWIQVQKDNPAPWPELKTPDALAPETPVVMQNRFDVFNNGAVTREAPEYRDSLEIRDDGEGPLNQAVAVLWTMLANHHDVPAIASLGTLHGKLTCFALNGKNGQPNHGSSRNCKVLVVAGLRHTPTAISVGQQVIRVDAPVDATGTLSLAAPIDTDANEIEVDEVDLAKVLSTPLLSFVHASDIQIRDPSVFLTDRKLSAHLDWFKPLDSFEYDEDLASYNQYVVQAMIATVNAAARDTTRPPAERPNFVIHTGDSVDANMLSELKRFHTLIDGLRIPFYELFGNHDVLVFGNLTPTDQARTGNDKKCTSVDALTGSHSRWAPGKICVDVTVKACPTCDPADATLIASPKGHEETRRIFMRTLHHDPSYPVSEPRDVSEVKKDGGAEQASDQPYCDAVPKVSLDGWTRSHGFDLGTSDNTLDGEPLGYYAFVRPLADGKRNAVFIGMNSEDFANGDGGIGGHIGKTQYEWIASILKCVSERHPADLVFSFAHQPLSMLEVTPGDGGATLEQLFIDHKKNFIAYFYGHNHEHNVCGDKRDGKTCHNFWEIETGSLVEFPQEMRMVRIKQVGQKLGFLELSTFGERLIDQSGPLAKYVALAHAGAMRDTCVTHEARCSADKRPYRTDGESTSARLFFTLP